MRPRHGRSTPEADDVSAASVEARQIISIRTVSAAYASFPTPASFQVPRVGGLRRCTKTMFTHLPKRSTVTQRTIIRHIWQDAGERRRSQTDRVGKLV